MAAIDPASQQATGLRIGEVTPEPAVALMRLTGKAHTNNTARPMANSAEAARSRGRSTRELEGLTPGARQLRFV